MSFKIKPRKVKKKALRRDGVLSISACAKAWNWSEQDVVEFFATLEQRGMITVDGPIVTVVDYDRWMSGEYGAEEFNRLFYGHGRLS
jgi:hypothetical protein